jgi:carbon-monoxide dehydrogenase large subunit
MALDAAHWSSFETRRAESATRGKLRGIGLATFIEGAGSRPVEGMRMRFEENGDVTLFAGTYSHGQGHETTFAQLVSGRLGISIDNVAIVHGDTDKVQMGMGTYGSRSGAVGMSALSKALDKIEVKAKKVAAHVLEASVDDIDFKDGKFTVKGTDKSIDFTFPAGVHICELEIDPQTGVVRIDRWTAVDDFGEVINPMIVEGQVHGGITQGIGQALYEGAVYNQNGQLLTASYMDYCMPRAADVPSYQVGMTKTACPSNPLGIKGCGEAGATAAPPAVINALTDALGHEHVPMPASPQVLWRAARASSHKIAAE